MILVALVEDEDMTRRAMSLALRERGFEVYEAADALAARALLKQQQVEAIIIDIGLPGPDGISFAAELRQRADVALVIVTRHAEYESRIKALDLGADDYLVKPVHFGELAARIRSVVRRRYPMRARRKRVGPWTIDLDARTATSDDTSAPLTRGEFDILARLVQADSKIVSREELLSVVSRRPEVADLRSVDTLVSRLRRKLGDNPDAPGLIVTAPGFGYRLRNAVGES